MSINVRSGSASRVIGSHVLPIKGLESTGPFYAQQKKGLLLLSAALSGLRLVGSVAG